MLGRYILRRISLLLFVLWALSLLSFSLLFLFPGDIINNLTGYGHLPEPDRLALIAKYQLDAPYYQQYFAFLGRILQGDWGVSLVSQAPVLTDVLVVFPATLELALYALFTAVVVGLPLGVLAAAYNKSWLQRVLMGGALLGYSTPIFWMALLLIMLFSLQLGWLPMSGRISLLFEVPEKTGFLLLDILLSDIEYKPQAMLDAIRHLLLPTVVLAIYPTTVLMRFTYQSMLDVLEQAYIKAARAKGLTRAQVIYKHALRNALLPVIRQLGLQFSNLITLAIITEVIFSWPGIGRWLIDSIYQRDFPAIQGGLMAVSSFIICATILTDLLHAMFNPLSRKDSHGQV